MTRYLFAAAVVVGLRLAVAGQEPPPLKRLPLPESYPAAALPRKPSTPPARPEVEATAPKPAESVPVAEVPLAPPAQAPQVTVEIIAPTSANIGEPLVHHLVVRNAGRAPVSAVRVEMELPAAAHYVGGEPRVEFPTDRLSWSLGTLDAGAERRIRVDLKSATEGDVRTRATVTFAMACGSTTRLTRPKLAVNITGPASALVGEPAVFQIHLANTGSGPIQKLLLRDRLPPGLRHPQGETLEAEVAGLAPGESRTLTLKTTAAKVGSFVHEIQAFGDGQAADVRPASGPVNPDLRAAARTEIRIVEPVLQVRLTGPKTCLVKCDGVLSIDLTNPGTAAAKDVHLAARIPDGLEFVGASDEGRYDAAERAVKWGLAVLEPGAHRALTLKVRGAALGEAVGTVVARADGGLSARAELPVRVEGVPALGLELVALDDPAPVGADATYEVRVLNRGTCPCTGIRIVAQLSDAMELLEASGPAPHRLQGRQVQFAPFPKLATKADLVYRVRVRSQAAGDVRFRVQLSCDQLPQPVTKEEGSRFFKP